MYCIALTCRLSELLLNESQPSGIHACVSLQAWLILPKWIYSNDPILNL